MRKGAVEEEGKNGVGSSLESGRRGGEEELEIEVERGVGRILGELAEMNRLRTEETV